MNEYEDVMAGDFNLDGIFQKEWLCIENHRYDTDEVDMVMECLDD